MGGLPWCGSDRKGRAPFSAALAVGIGAAGAQAQTIELKSISVPPNHAYHKWATAWAEQLGKDSGGRLKTTIYPNGQLVGR